MYAADALILGAPAYSGLISTQLINLFTRGREEMFFAHRMQYKIAAPVTLGWFGVGMDRALDCIHQLILSWMMFPLPMATQMAKAHVSTAWKGERPAYMPNGVLDDEVGVRRVKEVGQLLAEAAKMYKPGRDEWVAQNAKKSQAQGKKFIDGVWR
jgi:multimeric flavodoxin WrbA